MQGSTPDAVAIVIPQVMRDEGFRSTPSHSAAGALLIGYGTNLDEGLDADEAMFLLEYRMQCRLVACQRAFPWFRELSIARQAVLLQMAYQLGLDALRQFRGFLAALAAGDYARAADAMVESPWARESPSRAHRLAATMRGAVTP